MNTQYEYECICGYFWIDSENNGCPMCGEDTEIKIYNYVSVPPGEDVVLLEERQEDIQGD